MPLPLVGGQVCRTAVQLLVHVGALAGDASTAGGKDGVAFLRRDAGLKTGRFCSPRHPPRGAPVRYPESSSRSGNGNEAHLYVPKAESRGVT